MMIENNSYRNRAIVDIYERFLSLLERYLIDIIECFLIDLIMDKGLSQI